MTLPSMCILFVGPIIFYSIGKTAIDEGHSKITLLQ